MLVNILFCAYTYTLSKTIGSRASFNRVFRKMSIMLLVKLKSWIQYFCWHIADIFPSFVISNIILQTLYFNHPHFAACEIIYLFLTITLQGPIVNDCGGLPQGDNEMPLDEFSRLLDMMPSCKMMTISPHVEAKSGFKRIKILADRSVY